MKPPKKTIDHIINPESLHSDLADLQAKYSVWKSADRRGKSAVWTLLGKAYELGHRILKNDQLRADLIENVLQIPDVNQSNQWDPKTKEPFDLLMVRILGLKEDTKVTKSQWLRTLKAAELAHVPPNWFDFCMWIKKVGGISGALKRGSGKGSGRLGISELATKLPDKGPEFGFRSKSSEKVGPVEFNSNKISKTALKCDGLTLPEGFALILVQQSDEADKMWPIASIADERQITRALKSAVAENEKEERAFRNNLSSDEKRELAKMRQAARKEYRQGMKAKKKILTHWPDFLYEYSSEHGDEWPPEFRHLFPIMSWSKKI